MVKVYILVLDLLMFTYMVLVELILWMELMML